MIGARNSLEKIEEYSPRQLTVSPQVNYHRVNALAATHMTLVDIKNHIFTHLMTESTFSLGDDVTSVKLNKEDLTEVVAQHKIALFKTALTDLVRAGILAEVETVPGLYVLTQPLNSYSQNVTLSAMTAEMVVDLVNGFGEALSDEEGPPYVANKMGITGEDIARLCHICHMVLDEGSGGPP